MVQFIKLVLTIAAVASLTAGCSSLSKASGIKAKFKVLNSPEYLSPDPAKDDVYKNMLGDLRADQTMASERSRDWNLGESAFNVALLAAAAYGGYNTVYDGGNLKDAAFAGASITSLRTFMTPQRRRDAFAKAAAEMACVAHHANAFSKYSSATIARVDGSGATFKFSIEAGSAVGGFQAGTYEAAQAQKVNGLIAELADEVAKDIPDGTYSAKQAQAIVERRLDAKRRFDAVLDAMAKSVRANSLKNDILNERFSLVRGEYVDILADLFEALRFPEVDYAKESADFAEAKGESKETATNGVAAEAMMTTAGGPAGFMSILFSEPTSLAEARAALLACNKDE